MNKINSQTVDRSEQAYSHNRLVDAAYKRKLEYSEPRPSSKQNTPRKPQRVGIARPSTAGTSYRTSSCNPTTRKL